MGVGAAQFFIRRSALSIEASGTVESIVVFDMDGGMDVSGRYLVGKRVV